MDPYLEHPSLWPDVHNRLIAAIADTLTPKVAPLYYIGLERRAYIMPPDDVTFIGRPDIAVVSPYPTAQPAALPLAEVGVLEVELPISDKVEQSYLEVREVSTSKLVTILEVLSPANKLHDEGRKQYLRKRDNILVSFTNFVEIDLLRAGEPMPLVEKATVASHYRILVSRGWKRPKAQLYHFNLQHPIPTFPLPLLPQDDSPEVELGDILHALYTRARFDLRLDYSQPPVPPLTDAEAEWTQQLPQRS